MTPHKFVSFEKENTKICNTYENIGLDLANDSTLIIIKDILNSDECDEILEETNNLYSNLKIEYLETDRNAERILNINEKMAEHIYYKIKHIIEEEHSRKNLKPFGFGVEGQWKPIGINSCFRHSKYDAPSVGFIFHRDSSYIENSNKRSILSLIIYLNDDFDGGETLFVKPNTERKIGQIVLEELSEGYKILYKIKPQKNTAVLFNHNVIHSGMPVLNNTKYIIKTDIIFENINPSKDNYFLNDKYFLQAIEYYREANNQEMIGNVKNASELYEKGLALRQFHTT